MLLKKLQARKSIQVSTPAKLNLFLDVLGKRPDGYHEVSTVMCPVDLWDDLDISVRLDGKIELDLVLPSTRLASDPAWRIPADCSNLAYKAAELTQRTLGTSLGCNIKLTKRIPAAAGLGGGSGNAAGVVTACLALWSEWNRPTAGKICQGLGSDLNFFLGTQQGFGIAHATGRGENVKQIPTTLMLQFFLMHPPQGCATGEVYAGVRQMGCSRKTEDFLAACQTGQDSKIGAAMFNALQLPASEINDWIEIQLNLLAEECKYSLMSGSGSSCFGIASQGGSLETLRARAKQLEIERVYQVSTWYGRSIERQLCIQ
jgi:4-diphosphocytidyl-2-C-methyl-D-erythritol kinase